MLTLFFSGPWWGWSPSRSGETPGPAADLSQRRTTEHTLTRSHSHLKVTDKPNMHVFGLQQEARIPRDNMQTTEKSPSWDVYIPHCAAHKTKEFFSFSLQQLTLNNWLVVSGPLIITVLLCLTKSILQSPDRVKQVLYKCKVPLIILYLISYCIYSK